MKKRFASLGLLCLLALVGSFVAVGQNSPPNFTLVQELGQQRPRGIVYDPNFEQFVWTDALGRLQLIETQTLTVKQTLHETGFYNAYEFSHNGQYLALAIDRRIEIWDTQAGTILVQFEPDGALRAEGTLYWSPDDGILALNTQVRAPREVRRSENDTTNLVWLWDVASELGKRRTILPNARAIPFFDYRNGFVYGAHNKALVGLPERLQLLDITPRGTNVVGEIPMSRFELDPMFVWKSLRDDFLYVRSSNGAGILTQVDTRDNAIYDLNLARDWNYANLAELDGLKLSSLWQIIGEPNDTEGNSALRLLLGESYRDEYAYHPLTVMLVDILIPQTEAAEGKLFLIYIFDETRGVGRFDLFNPSSISDFALHPNNQDLLFRLGESRLELYNLPTGQRVQHYETVYPNSSAILAFDDTGTIIMNDFQRFDTRTGDVLAEDLQFHPGFNEFYFLNNDTLITEHADQWWEWDIPTAQVTRRETLNDLGDIYAVSEDGTRILSRISNGFEIVKIGAEERPQVFFLNLPDVRIEQIFPSPDWQHFLVLYGTNEYGQHYPSNEIMMYSLEKGALWHIAGADLPSPNGREYRWLDNETFTIRSVADGGSPERVYGVDYAANGIPSCLVENFPNRYDEWVLIWERLNRRMDAASLHRLSASLCQQSIETRDEVNSYLFPTVTPTRLPVTATPAAIAGVPLCITNRFPQEAQAYALIWREMIDGLDNTEVLALEELVCENLTGQAVARDVQARGSNPEIMLIDVATGYRRVGSYVPAIPRQIPPNLAQAMEDFRLQYGSSPRAKLSPDGSLMAVLGQGNLIRIYRTTRPYPPRIEVPTNSQVQRSESLALRPTATLAFTFLGAANPTLTPTVTPTAPPRAETHVENPPQWGNPQEICPFNELFTMDNLPPDYAPIGRIITQAGGERGFWSLNPQTGEYVLEQDLPVCLGSGACDFSPDNSWLRYTLENGDLVVARPDGTDQRILYYGEALPNEITSGFAWLDNQTLQYSYNAYLPNQTSTSPHTFLRRYLPETDSFDDAIERIENPIYNDLPTSRITRQPIRDPRYDVVSVSFNTGNGVGQRYFIYDHQLDEFLYIGRLSTGSMNFDWLPDGSLLYYNYSDSNLWYSFDPVTREMRVIGESAPPLAGTWSFQKHYNAAWFNYADVNYNDYLDRSEAQRPVPTLRIWDSQTGAMRWYCMPPFNSVSANLLWSFDERYLLFRYQLPEALQAEGKPNEAFYVLDSQTGSLTLLTEEYHNPLLWLREKGGY